MAHQLPSDARKVRRSGPTDALRAVKSACNGAGPVRSVEAAYNSSTLSTENACHGRRAPNASLPIVGSGSMFGIRRSRQGEAGRVDGFLVDDQSAVP